MKTSPPTTSELPSSSFPKTVPPASPVSSSPCSPSILHRFFLGHGGAALLGGLCEIIVFHPFDTIAKRLMAHRERVVDPSNLSTTGKNLYQVVFGGLLDEAKKKWEVAHGQGTSSTSPVIRLTLWEKCKHLYPGSKYAVLYKVSQRVVKFAGQPVFREYLHTHYHSFFFPPDSSSASAAATTTTTATVLGSTSTVKTGSSPPEGSSPPLLRTSPLTSCPPLSSLSGTRGSAVGAPPPLATRKKDGGRGGLVLELVSGSLIGVSETVLLPFDRMKVLHQTNRGSMTPPRGLCATLWAFGPRKLYAGAVTTASRNAVGTALFFAGTALSKEYFFGLHSGNYKETTFTQNLLASTVGGVIGVVATSPMDVVKTRIQGQRLEGNLSGWYIFTETCKKEGFSAFYKGITPKVLTSAPKLVFGYTMTQFFLKYLKN